MYITKGRRSATHSNSHTPRADLGFQLDGGERTKILVVQIKKRK